jgi:arginine/lysine/ornithine decarboxylase
MAPVVIHFNEATQRYTVVCTTHARWITHPLRLKQNAEDRAYFHLQSMHKKAVTRRAP